MANIVNFNFLKKFNKIKALNAETIILHFFDFNTK